MAVWTTLVNSLFLPGKKILGSTGMALRDNLIAVFEGDTTAPINQAHWHPYNKLSWSDANTGKFYDFQTAGAVASVVSPDFEDRYAYRVRVEGLSSSTAPASLQIALYLETDAGYGTTITIAGSMPNTGNSISGIIDLPLVRKAVRAQPVLPSIVRDEANGSVLLTAMQFACVRAAQKRTRAQFAFSAGNIDAGKLFLDRMRVAF